MRSSHVSLLSGRVLSIGFWTMLRTNIKNENERTDSVLVKETDEEWWVAASWNQWCFTWQYRRFRLLIFRHCIYIIRLAWTSKYTNADSQESLISIRNLAGNTMVNSNANVFLLSFSESLNRWLLLTDEGKKEGIRDSLNRWPGT